MRALATYSAIVSLAVLGFSPQNAIASSADAKSCSALFQAHPSKMELAWQALNHDPNVDFVWLIVDRTLAITNTMNAEERLEFAERLATHPEAADQWKSTFLVSYLLKTRSEDPERGLTGEQLFKLFKKFNFTSALNVATQRERFFPLLTKRQLMDLTRIYSEKYPLIMKTYGGAFPISEEQKAAVFRRLAKTQGSQILRESRLGSQPNAIRQQRSSSILSIEIPNSVEETVLRTAFASDAFQALRSQSLEFIPAIDNDLPLEAEAGKRSIRSILELVAQKYPALLDPSVTPLLWDRVKNIEVGFGILREVGKLNERGIPTPRTSLDVLGLALGYDAQAIGAAKLSDRQVSQLYELSLDLSSKFDRPPFEGVAIDPAIWQAKQIKDFLDLLGYLRDLNHLQGNKQSTWKRMTDEIGLRQGVRPESLQDLKTRARRILIASLEGALKESKTTISQMELDSLYKRWGSVEPIITLIARFNGRTQWRSEIPVLAKVLKAVLSNRFLNFKYEGDLKDPADQEMAKDQLESLTTESSRAGWKQNRTKIEIYDPNAAVSESDADRVLRARTIATSNLFANLTEKANGPTLDGQAKDALLAQIIQTNQVPSLRDLTKSLNAHSSIIERTLLRSLVELNDVAAMRKVATFLKGNAPAFGYQGQTTADLSSIISALAPQKKSEQSVVFTTTFDSPKMLLTIGDLVDTASCQNYKTGSHIETLLGYVMDAGVKGLAAYVLKPTHFAKQQDFSLLVEALQAKANGQDVEVRPGFEPDQGVARFKILRAGRQEAELNTVALSKAQLRVVIKLGKTTNGKPGVFAERPYEQTHAARPIILGHLSQIQDDIANAIDGVTGQEIMIPASRNVGGVYSDAAHGAQTGAYRIRPSATPSPIHQ